MTYRSKGLKIKDNNSFSFKKSELLAVLQAIDSSFNFDSEESNYIKESDSNNLSLNSLPHHIRVLAMNDYFTVVESACFISLDEPEKIQSYLDNDDYAYNAWNYGGHIQAVKVIEGGIKAKKLVIDSDGLIPRALLQKFLFDRDCIIDGFNKDFKERSNTNFSDHKVEVKSSEIQRLKAELNEKTKQLESILIQTNSEESKLSSTRAENNVAKLILVLAKMADIDISKPYANYESLKVTAELLGIERFPSDENVASWLKKANSQNPS